MGKLLQHIGSSVRKAGAPVVNILETKLVEIEMRKLRISRMGKSGPVLIFLHGYPDNLQIWCKLIPLFAGKFETVAFDWPGTGYSDESPGGTTPEHMAARLKSIMDALQIDKASIIGQDMGGQPALVFAAKYPERIEKLVVMNCLAFGDEKTSLDIALLRRFGFNRLVLRHLPWIVFRRAVSTFLPPGTDFPRALYDDMWQSFRQPRVASFISKMCAGYQGTLHKLPEFYKHVKCPTVILWAERDKHFPLVQARRLEATVPNSKLYVLKDAEHWMCLYRADEVAVLIERFLAS